MDTEVVIDDGSTLKTMADLKPGMDRQVLFIQHATYVLKKDVLSVKNAEGKTLCGTPDHIVK